MTNAARYWVWLFLLIGDNTSHSLRGSVDWNQLALVPVAESVVTPCVGVWIEIVKPCCLSERIVSLPAWECGLKLVYVLILAKFAHGSLPAWECGLKLYSLLWYFMSKSHSLRGSVDWNPFRIENCWLILVTPCVGVWIEIELSSTPSKSSECHSLRGSVDWNQYVTRGKTRTCKVTPCVGVWIEIRVKKSSCSTALKSLPAWECGLKFCVRSWFFCKLLVTPCVGVWIEIPCQNLWIRGDAVTPCVGVWIEIVSNIFTIACKSTSLPAWECGLKYLISEYNALTGLSLPAWECGLKFICAWAISNWNNGHSLRGSVDWNMLWAVKRGWTQASLPAWECGLKSHRPFTTMWQFVVTPCVGVWIEMAN